MLMPVLVPNCVHVVRENVDHSWTAKAALNAFAVNRNATETSFSDVQAHALIMATKPATWRACHYLFRVNAARIKLAYKLITYTISRSCIWGLQTHMSVLEQECDDAN